MKIAIDGLSANLGGGRTYLHNLLRQFDRDLFGNEYLVFVLSSTKDSILGSRHSRVKVIEVQQEAAFARFLYQQFILPLVLLSEGADVLYSPGGIVPFLAPCTVVLAIQDVGLFYREKRVRRSRSIWRHWIVRELVRQSAKRAVEVVFVSEFSRKLLSDKLRLPGDKTCVIYHGVDLHRFYPPTNCQSGHKVNPKYILCVSHFYPHKNLETLLKAYAMLDSELVKRHELVLVGRAANQHRAYAAEMRKLTRDLGIEGNVRFTGEAPYPQIHLLYRNAKVLVFPSSLEVFGIPLVEAMAAGVPVVAANGTAIPEIVSDAALLFNPFDPRDLRDKMELVLNDNSLWSQLRARGLQRAQAFSWERCAQATLAVLHQAADETLQSA